MERKEMTRLALGIALTFLTLGGFAGSSWAESEISGQSSGDFTFRRVAPPKAAASKRHKNEENKGRVVRKLTEKMLKELKVNVASFAKEVHIR